DRDVLVGPLMQRLLPGPEREYERCGRRGQDRREQPRALTRAWRACLALGGQAREEARVETRSRARHFARLQHGVEPALGRDERATLAAAGDVRCDLRALRALLVACLQPRAFHLFTSHVASPSAPSSPARARARAWRARDGSATSPRLHSL